MTPRPEPATASKPSASTIAAIATAPGRGGVGIVRISGHMLQPLAQALCGKVPLARVATVANFYAADGSVIDSGLVVYFSAPASYTGEDVLELHGHGGTHNLGRLLAAVLERGARLAEPGEFTRRAVLNGKLDLLRAEALVHVHWPET